MFAAPPEGTAQCFARLPDEFRAPVGDSPWLRRQRGGAQTHSFLEGPSFDLDGNLYVVDIAKGRIFRVSPAGEFQLVAEYDGEPNGLKIHRDGRIFVADHANGLMLVDPDSGRVEPLLTRPKLERFRGLNDLVFASNGDLYFTDQGQSGLHDPTGRVWRMRCDGQLEKLLDNVPSPNGIAFSPDEKTLYVAVTRQNAIWRVPLIDGEVGRVGLFIQLSGSLGGPDGIAVDQDGGLAVCQIGMGSVWCFNRLGEPTLRIRCPQGLMPSNLAFGGRNFGSLFITEVESGSVLQVDAKVQGLPLYSHAGRPR
jgi:gluconolactonase